MNTTAARHGSFTKSLQGAPAVLVLLGALALSIVAYAPGLGGSFHFDDEPSLEGLASVDDASSAFRFIMDGIAGPLGRPIALATFAPQAYAWPDAPVPFLYVNICIHLLNGMLVAWALYLIGLARNEEPSRAAWIAAISAAIWMVSPLLASSSLFIIQRMTTLAATFSLLGIVGYLYARGMLGRAPRLALLLMTLALTTGAALAALSKENGALLPLFVLVLEITLLTRPRGAFVDKIWNIWLTVVLIVPAAALAGYLLMQVDYPEALETMRGFSVTDRLLTQAHVLWQYLYNAFIPATSHLGPFHDDYPVYSDWLHPRSLLAVGAWVVVIACAIRFRRKAPLLGFAVGWYLVGHSLESTTIPLELYFEHRNYLPLIGPVYAAAAGLSAIRAAPRLVKAGLVAYMLVLSSVLFSTTSLWGNPALAAEVWYIERPHSTRAVQYIAQRMYDEGDLYGVRRVLSDFAEAHPRSVSTSLQALLFSCVVEPRESHETRLDAIWANLDRAKFEYSAFAGLRDLYRMAVRDECDSIDRNTVYELTSAIAAHPAYVGVPVMQHNLHLLMSEEGFLRRDLDMTMRHIETALEAHYTMSSLFRAVRMLVSAGLYSTAQEFVKDAYRRKPGHPIRAARWTRDLAALEKAIRAASHAAAGHK